MLWKNKQLMPAAKQKKNTKRRWIVPMLASAVVLVAGCGKISEWLGDASVSTAETVEGGLDWSKPDALIRTQSLADVPKDLLTVPLARDVLTEDFLFFYEQEERFLSIKGAIRRVAYEHELKWSDKMLHSMLDEPAEIAFWRGESGAIEQFAIAADRGNVASLLMQAGKLKFDDENVRKLFAVQVDGDAVPVYALGYGGGRELVFAAKGSRVVVASSIDMVQNTVGKVYAGAHTAFAELLKAKAGGGFFNQAFAGKGGNAQGVSSGSLKHSVLVRTHFLSMGYQRFFPALRAMRFDFGGATVGGDAWQTSVLLNGEALLAQSGGADAPSAFQRIAWYMPQQSAACVALPVQWSALNDIAKPLKENVQQAAAQFAQRAVGPLGVCWSDASRLHNPAFVVQFKPAGGGTDENTAGAMALDEALPVLMQAFVRGFKSDAASSTDKGFQAFAHRWGSKAQFGAELIHNDKVLIVSPDAVWAKKLLSVAQQTQPALSDVLPKNVSGGDGQNSVVLGYIAPKQLAQLAEKEVHTSLPRSKEKILRAVADNRLTPRLQALEKHKPMALLLPASALQNSSTQWYSVPWKTVAGVR